MTQQRTPFTGETATQMHHARRGVITPEMARVAEREDVGAGVRSATRSRAGAWSSPPTSTTPRLEPMAIGINAHLQDQRQHRQLGRALRTSTRSWRSCTSPCTSAPTR